MVCKFDLPGIDRNSVPATPSFNGTDMLARCGPQPPLKHAIVYRPSQHYFSDDPATSGTDVLVRCDSPPSRQAVYTITIAFNGVDQTTAGPAYTMYAQPIIENAAPRGGPSVGNTKVGLGNLVRSGAISRASELLMDSPGAANVHKVCPVHIPVHTHMHMPMHMPMPMHMHMHMRMRMPMHMHMHMHIRIYAQAHGPWT